MLLSIFTIRHNFTAYRVLRSFDFLKENLGKALSIDPAAEAIPQSVGCL